MLKISLGRCVFLRGVIFSVDLYIKDNPHLFRRPMKHLNFNLYNLNSSYSPLLYKIVTLHTQIYNKQNNLHGKDSLGPSYLSPFNHSNSFVSSTVSERGTVLFFFFYGFGDSRQFVQWTTFPLILGETKLQSWLSPPFQGPHRGGERGKSSGTPLLRNPMEYTLCASRKNSWKWGWGARRDGKAHSSSAWMEPFLTDLPSCMMSQYLHANSQINL